MSETVAPIDDPTKLGATAAAAAIRDRRLKVIDLIDACLRRIEEEDEAVKAWTFVDRQLARDQAANADAALEHGRSHGPLHGVPVGVQDTLDTADMPTTRGSPVYDQRAPGRDATAVARLRDAGAIVIGKTETAEFGYLSPPRTCNPLDLERAPGGAAGGAAAAVAAHMVPAAAAVQAAGSIICAASYCGIYGFKPSHGAVPTDGSLLHSRYLDTVGAFGTTLADVAAMADAMGGNSPDRPLYVATRETAPETKPRIALARTPFWPQIEAETQRAFLAFAETLGRDAQMLELPSLFAAAAEWQRKVHDFDLARVFGADCERSPQLVSRAIKASVTRGRRIPEEDYEATVLRRKQVDLALTELLQDYDALAIPSAPDVAPVGLRDTADPVLVTPWTYCGAPVLGLPLLRGQGGLPVGVQLITPKGEDVRLMRTAAWLIERVAVKR
jgi:Asp-tRNA(Asn)/Glu-tRNA(Gln) amidotransferase A subunit family amidase